ncbi:MAG: HDIG domain-containing protein [Coriobacteriia bacterium]|nr:HDIG domain-containing protein [Coriobacteriia bacterium]
MSRQRLINRLSRFWPKTGPLSTSLGHRVLLGVVVIVLAAAPLAVRVVPLGLNEGEPAPRTFRAPRSVQYVDQAATDALRQAASDAVNPVYIFDQEAQSEARQGIVEFFSSASSVIATSSGEMTGSIDATRAVGVLAETYGSRVGTDTIETVLQLSPTSLDTVARNTEGLVSSILSGRIQEGDLQAARDQLAQSAGLIPLTLTERLVVISVGNAYIEPTVNIDEAATERAGVEAVERVAPVVVFVQEGENIVEKGDIVTARDIELVRTLGGLEQGTDLGSVIAGVLLMSALIAFAGAYWASFHEALWASMRDLMLLSTLLLGMMYVTRLTSLLAPDISPYLMPVPLVGILATLLVSPRSAVLITAMSTVAALLLGFAGGAQAVAAIVASVASIVMTARLRRRADMFRVSAFIIAILGTVSFGASLASGNEFVTSVVSGGYGMAAGLITAVLMIGLLPFFESVFGVTSGITLLELGSPSHPLLRRLMTEAPGTYSHSVMTANLAETAAEAIGANPLLARAGAYFHDIGKVRRPAFFVENQAGGTNPHDATSPSLSARIITAHVREGVELAEEYGLPSEVVDIIREHHGTSVVAYFYDKASKKGGPVYEADFRYDGRRPQTPEAALVMIADASEAAVRTLDKHTPERIEALIRAIVRGKIDDHQLDESRLTLHDIETVTLVYARMLASVYHPRIEYPEPAEKKVEHAGQYREPQRA